MVLFYLFISVRRFCHVWSTRNCSFSQSCILSSLVMENRASFLGMQLLSSPPLPAPVLLMPRCIINGSYSTSSVHCPPGMC